MAPRESSKPSFLSEEYVVDSSDDQDAARSDEIENADTKAILETPPKQRSTAKASKHKKGKTTSPPRQSISRSHSLEEDGHSHEEQDQEEDDDSSDDDDDDDDDDEPAMANFFDDSAKQASSKSSSGMERPMKKSKTSPSNKLPIPPKQYIPPPGFIQRPVVAPDSASEATRFLTANLTGKEVWHIVAPANVSINSIRPFSIQAAMRGEPILTSEGKWYCLKDESSTKKCILTPNDTEDAYVPGKAAISRTFHLREMVNPPATGKASGADQAVKMYFEFQPHDEMPTKPKRKQPEGLRMRYQPFGTIGTSPEESGAERSQIYIPDQIPTLPADHHERRKPKSQQTRRPRAAEAEADAMEVDLSETPSKKAVSPQSTKPLKKAPSKQLTTGDGWARQDKTKKRNNNNTKIPDMKST